MKPYYYKFLRAATDKLLQQSYLLLYFPSSKWYLKLSLETQTLIIMWHSKTKFFKNLEIVLNTHH